MVISQSKLTRLVSGFWLAAIVVMMLLASSSNALAQAEKVTIVSDASGIKLQVGGKDFMVNGMNWDYFPIGTNYSYSLWNQPDDLIKAALDAEMSLLKSMGVNAVRVYTGVQPKWVTYMYENYGVYTMLNHSFGRYGLPLDGTFVSNTEYSDPRVRELLLKEVKAMVNEFKGVPGVLMYLLGNENNYGLFWEGAETEDIPMQDRKSTIRARHMYKLFNEAAVAMQAIDSDIPVAMCNGDMLFIDIIAEECKDVDIYGTNMYRGYSFGDAFQVTKDKLNKPILFTEFGSDAFNAISNAEDQYAQAGYMVENWEEIYANAAGLGKVGNSIGGFTFQFSDGWWKYGQTENLDVHDNNASWANGGYRFDFAEGENNMNEEWFGICAKGPTDASGLYQLYPRAAYYALRKAHSYNPYVAGSSADNLKRHFDNILLMDAVLEARGDRAALLGQQSGKVRISGARFEFTSFSTGGDLITTPDNPDPDVREYPNELGFGHMQSFYTDIEANPTNSVRGTVSFNVLGNVPENPIDEIFYENTGRSRQVRTDEGNLTLSSLNRVRVHQASVSWKSRLFDLDGFYRTGHYHWGYEGDFFGLYPEANYGPNIDLYNGIAPVGMELHGKRSFNGLKVAFGPELWWGANPAVLLKYTRKIAGMDVTGIFHEDLDEQAPAVSSFAVPIPPTRRATLHVETKLAGFGVDLGGIWSGDNWVGESFQLVDGTTGNYRVLQDDIETKDTFGGKLKLTLSKGAINWYASAAAQGLVARGGADITQTFTGWRLKDSGSGNQMNVLSGFTYNKGSWQFAPNFLYQKPIEGPIPSDVQAPGRPRNVLDDPFAVRGNRETTAGEILITYDPTPGSWMYAWDNDMAEDASLAASVGFVYRNQPTSQDAAIGILGDGRTTFAFPGAPPARDLWEAHARIISKTTPGQGLIANLFAGNAEPNGDDPRLVKRYGGDLRMILGDYKMTAMAKINDWGPYDFHRDFNLTYPVQLMADFSTTVGSPQWHDIPQTRLGVRFTWRSLDENSPRYCPTQAVNDIGVLECVPTADGFSNGSEWEIRTYLHFNIGM